MLQLIISTNVKVNMILCCHSFSLHHNLSLSRYFNLKSFTYEQLSYHEIRVGQTHRRPTRPKIRVGLVLHVLHGSGAYV